MEVKKVYQAVCAVSSQIAKKGISKSSQNQQQGFKFRGIDDVLNALNGALTANNLCIFPKVLSRECVERQTKAGGSLFTVTLCVEFTIVSALDGSSHTVIIYGEAMDSGDKATNKALSAAYKYMALQVFCIPTEGDNDADLTTHPEVISHRAALLKCSTPAEITAYYKSIGSPTDTSILALFTERKNKISTLKQD
jgi:hypothetical protein